MVVGVQSNAYSFGFRDIINKNLSDYSKWMIGMLVNYFFVINSIISVWSVWNLACRLSNVPTWLILNFVQTFI